MPGRLFASAAALLLSALVLAGEARAWGAAGHAIVAEIAQRRLQPATKARIRDLLGGDVSLASISNWADTLALTGAHTRRWHFVNIPVGAGGYDPARDCRATAQGDCIVAAIGRAVETLSNAAAGRPRRAEALKLLVHLVADLHQPLHCTERDGDAGGATLAVTFFGTPSTLHQAWDVGLIERASYDWGDHVRQITAWLVKQDAAALVQGEPAQWAWETHRVAVEAAYGGLTDTDLGEAYQARNLPVVHRQLGLAGLRLARLLDEALSAGSRSRSRSHPRPRQAATRCPLG
jgi:hypothetical protein